MIAESINSELKHHIKKVQYLHQADLEKGLGETILPTALARKYPAATHQFKWQYLFA